ncbi:MAG: Triosephosphate isomerase [Alphaproteobacteria bacterium MarineAlpha5_Bin8]|mgnify:CR=1 FL=1|nr:MAG: Triosephosphate isomerase [Alphaproteobacteria bacterium MarineAlpha5_Bin7]PPR44937.1 MAG: Triosephosphate isomerase [Alphaproteobacteria bacterium MarineAlpha5_Bin8]PPR53288.1 MAG: Triosephosphate isomerase [Alphaproteobacteria bacterium MarineAlpha5_Bin6]|tara:strand:- start:619 stop:1353 length:735 start_codon:yes stop_codon:yes gene_type:complete
MLDLEKYRKIIVANWKMNGSIKFINDFSEKLALLENLEESTCRIICPPFVYLQRFRDQLNNFYFGGQECSQFDEGAFTGNISAKMLKDLNCNFCIVGHSERRKLLNEQNFEVSKKSSNCINFNIHPIICVGETLEEKNLNKTREIIEKQINESVPENANKNNTIIAYEPIWAIGTGLTPSLEEIDYIHQFIKKDIKTSKDYKILYGGSVKSSNFKEIIQLTNVDGTLIGGASVIFDEFKKILYI